MSIKEATLDLSGRTSRRRSSAPKAGSVWESRMKLDQVKGGFKVFAAADGSSPENADPSSNPEAEMGKNANDAARPKQSPTGKRKTWKSESPGGSPVHIARQRSEPRKSLDQEINKELGDPKKSPVWIKAKRSISLKSDSADAAASDGEKIKNCGGDEPNGELGGQNRKIDENPPAGVENSRSGEGFKDDERVKVDDKKLVHSGEISLVLSPALKKQPPSAVTHTRFHPPTKTKPIQDHSPDPPRRHSILQSLVDLVMWRDVSKSTFVFGIGAFAIISSAFSKDLSISFISVISYMGLVYLAAIFFFRSLIRRRSTDLDGENKDCVVGEEEAIWLVKLLLPHVNEFLLNLRALFSGDPATTMKLAVLLFILARCGGSITIWKMAKLGFVVVFTVPKICSTYSSRLTAYGTFWIHRFRDVWESCSHKKAVAFAIFTLVWNLSSVVARIWAVFMLFVAFKYYQQSLIEEGCANDENNIIIGGPTMVPKSTETGKEKKVY